jgi:hypothetical protein
VVVVLADGEADTLAYGIAVLFLQLREQLDIPFYLPEASLLVSHLVMDFFRSIDGKGDVHPTDGAEMLGKAIEEGSVGVNGEEDPPSMDVLQKFNNPLEKKRLTATNQDKSDLALSDFIDEPLPILQRHALPRVNGAVADISLFTPLTAHLAAKITGVGDCEGNELWKS